MELNDWFKSKPFFIRSRESSNIRKKYDDRFPIIVGAGKDAPYISDFKYLAPRDMTVGMFIFTLRNKMKINKDQAIFLFILKYKGQTMIEVEEQLLAPSTKLIGELYSDYASDDGFLYVQYQVENTFGSR
jgi:GABA(A) receptor-associated protein